MTATPEVEVLAEVIVDALVADPADDLHMEWLRADADTAAAAVIAAGWSRALPAAPVEPVEGRVLPPWHCTDDDGEVWEVSKVGTVDDYGEVYALFDPAAAPAEGDGHG